MNKTGNFNGYKHFKVMPLFCHKVLIEWPLNTDSHRSWETLQLLI